MIGIVVVSHSHALGTAAAALAAEMVPEPARPRVEVAAGLDETTFGTDAVAVAEAIARADSPDGVLVLLDLGSAVLSAEMALELLDPGLAGRTRLSSAPLVEGLVAAVVTASGGADLDTVAGEARRGLLPKNQHLGDGQTEPVGDGTPVATPTAARDDEDTGGPGGPARDARHLVVTVDIGHGLHARPAARLVAAVARHPEAAVLVSNMSTGAGPVDGRSLSMVAGLGVREGHQVGFEATGPTAQAALDTLQALADEGFGDRPAAGTSGPAPSPDGAAGAGAPVAGGPVAGAPVADAPIEAPPLGSGLGAAIGPALRPHGAPDHTAYQDSGDPLEEAGRLDRALQQASAQLAAIAEDARRTVGVQNAAIFDAQLALLDDPALTGPARGLIAGGVNALRSWHEAVGQVSVTFAQADDAYLQDRAQDVRAVGERVERALLGVDAPEPGPDVGILVVRELDPAMATLLDPSRVTGVITIGGGATGHGAIVASARGVPVLTGAGQRADVPAGTVVAFDQRTRELLVDPTPAQRAAFERMLAARMAQRARAQARAGEPGVTRDGRPVAVKANVSSAQEAAQAALAGAEGSGLVRAEVLFAHLRTAPTVDQQVAAFTAIAQAMGGPVTVRTWDVGADKPLPFWHHQPELNPFLGVRGVRAFRRDPTLLLDQLEAVCRVAGDYRLGVMFPMVSTVAEVDWLLARLEEAATRIEGATGRPGGLRVGIMIEVPAAALRAGPLTTGLDFVSLGTNDLTQYTLAAERGNPALEMLADPVDPAVLRLVDLVCREVADGVEVGVCGDAAGDPAIAALLVGLGVDALSATPASVPDVKALLRERSMAELRDLAARALRCDSAAGVRRLLVDRADRDGQG